MNKTLKLILIFGSIAAVTGYGYYRFVYLPKKIADTPPPTSDMNAYREWMRKQYLKKQAESEDVALGK